MEMKLDSDGTPYVMWGKNKIQLEANPVPEPAVLDVAKLELRESPEVVKEAIAELRQLLKDDPSLYIPVERDDFLLKFLRPCKFYAESALKRIQAYYKFRLSYKDNCTNLQPSLTRNVFEHSVVSILSPRDQHGRRILLIEAGEGWNPREVPLTDVFRGTQMGLESAMKEPTTQICGVVVIFDMKGLSFNQVMQFTPSYAKMVIEWIQDCVPIRLKAVHVINQPYIFNMVFAVFKPFMREKLRARIHFHGTNRESLLSHINGEALRKRHGGLLPEPEIPGDVLWKMLHHYEDEFKYDPSLYIPVERDDFLLKFLRPCKFYAESALKRIQAYYKFRLSYKDNCTNLQPSLTRNVFEHSVVSILSPRDQHGRRILLIEAGEGWNPREVPLTDVFRGTQMGLESAMKEPTTQICGVVVIFDMKGLSFNQVMQFTPSYAKMVIEWIQDCVPIRLKAVHVINQPYIFNMVFAVFKPFMREKLRARIHFHGTNRESLLSHINGEALRKRHGGLLPEPEIPGDVLWKMLHHYEDEFKLASSYGYKEKISK